MSDLKNLFLNACTSKHNLGIQDFICQLPGNTDKPFKQDVAEMSDKDTLGPVEALTNHTQNAIKAIREESDFVGKLNKALQSAHQHITPEIQYGGLTAKETHAKFDEIDALGKGDCDDYMNYEAGLLVHAGVNPTDIYYLGGMIKYSIFGQEQQEGHALLVVKDPNEDQYYLLDNNLASVVEIDPSNPIVTNSSTTDGNSLKAFREALEAQGLSPDEQAQEIQNTIDLASSAQITMEILYVSYAKDAQGINFTSEKATNLNNEYMDLHVKKYGGELDSDEPEPSFIDDTIEKGPEAVTTLPGPTS